MENNLIYVTAPEIIQIHDGLIDVSGGVKGIINPTSLDYVAETQMHYSETPTLPGTASYLLCRIAKGHQFADGNKRTAYFTARYFLMRNGADFNGSDPEEASHEIEYIAAQPDMDSACGIAGKLVDKYLIRDQIRIPDYPTFHRMIVKSIGVAHRLSKR